MVHVPFDTRTVVGYDDYIPQYGGSLPPEENNGEPPMHYFRGMAPFQRGYGINQHGGGIGDVLQGLLRMLIPMVRRAGTAVGREALSTGERILNKVAEGENVKQSVISEGKRGVDTLLEKSGLPKQFGSGTIKGVRRRPFHQTLIGKVSLPTKKPQRKKRRQRVDTFGFY